MRRRRPREWIGAIRATIRTMKAGLLAIALASTVLDAAAIGPHAAPPNRLPPADVAFALKTAVPDLGKRLAHFKPITVPFASAGLTPRERQMVDQLVLACQFLERMYWRQSDPDRLAVYKALAQ